MDKFFFFQISGRIFRQSQVMTQNSTLEDLKWQLEIVNKCIEETKKEKNPDLKETLKLINQKGFLEYKIQQLSGNAN